MTQEVYGLIAMILGYSLYVGVVLIKFGKQPSISDSFYRWKGEWGLLFTAFCVCMGFGAMAASPTPLMIISGAGICIVGVMPRFYAKEVGIAHYIGAGLCIIGSHLAIFIEFKDWKLGVVSIFFMIIYAITDKKYRVWNIENIAIIAIIIELTDKILKQ